MVLRVFSFIPDRRMSFFLLAAEESATDLARQLLQPDRIESSEAIMAIYVFAGLVIVVPLLLMLYRVLTPAQHISPPLDSKQEIAKARTHRQPPDPAD